MRHQCTRTPGADRVFCPVCGKVFMTFSEEFQPDEEAQVEAARCFARWVSETKRISESERPNRTETA